MKRKLFALMMILCLLTMQVLIVHAANVYLVDEANLLTTTEAASLEKELEEISNRQGVDVVVVTMNSTNGQDVMDVADDYYDYGGYRDDGILLLISMEERDWWISTAGYGITAVTDARLEYMADSFLPYLSDGEYAQAFREYARLCDEFITTAKNGEPAKKHKHDLSRVPQTPADCTHGGNIEYYFCVGCNDCFTDAGGKNKIPEYMSVEVGALGHTVSDYWNYDGEYHWRNCTVCKEILLETKMLHDSADGKCATCDCVIGSGETSPEISILPTEANVPAETKPGMPAEKVPESTNDRERSDGTVLAVVLVALVSFAASITATVILLKMKKKGE